MTGGGTLGPVTPLLAIAREWQRRDPHAKISWIGTPKGPERMIVEEAGYAFASILAPKISRHKKWTWPFIPILMLYACIHAFILLKKMRPDFVFTAGGYVSVPVVWMARLLGIPSWVHQLDVKPGIANRVMTPFAKRISVTWLDSLDAFPEGKTRHAGSVVRDEIFKGDKERALREYALDPQKPTLFILGGGTGAQAINEAMAAIAHQVADRANVIHLTGIGKMMEELNDITNYAAIEFLGKDIADCYALADVVVARAGMGTILELSALGKASILIPLKNTDQLANAGKIAEAQAGVVLGDVNGQILKQEILRLFEEDEARWAYQDRIRELFIQNGEERIVKEAMEVLSDGVVK